MSPDRNVTYVAGSYLVDLEVFALHRTERLEDLVGLPPLVLSEPPAVDFELVGAPDAKLRANVRSALSADREEAGSVWLRPLLELA